MNARFKERAEIINQPEKNNVVAKFRLRDYLSPNGKYPYEELTADMTEAVKNYGYTVYLFSVSGELMLSGNPDLATMDGFGWHKDNEWFETAEEAMKI